MTFKEFDEFQDKLFFNCKKMRDTKGKEYAHSLDRFANFNRLAEGLDLTPQRIAWIYAKKHIDSIESFIRDNKTYSTEPIYGRFVDAIVYFSLIAGIIDQQALSKVPKNYFGLGSIVTSNLDDMKCAKCGYAFLVNDMVKYDELEGCYSHKNCIVVKKEE